MRHNDILVDDVLYWLDPDDGICSGWVTVKSLNGDIIVVEHNNSIKEVFSTELFNHEI